MWELWILNWTAHPDEEMFGFERSRVYGIKFLKRAAGCSVVEARDAMNGLDNGVPFRLGIPKSCTQADLRGMNWTETVEWLSQDAETEWRYAQSSPSCCGDGGG